MTRIVVVKIGGSLHEHPQLRSWLSNIATYGGGRAVIVPGGGPYADVVRRAQAKWSFSNRDAHHMALQAMDLYGRMLIALEPRLKHATLEPQLRGMLQRGEAVVCSASTLLHDGEVEESWEVTSDSIAALLARRLGASALVLVKSIAPSAGQHQASVLATRGIVDRRFADYIAQARARVWWCGPDNPTLVRNVLEGRWAEAEVVAG